MECKKDTAVAISYELKTSPSGKIIEKIDDNQPLTILIGHKNLLPKFEQKLLGLESGDAFDIKLKCEDAYGEPKKQAIVNVPKKAFMQNGKVREDLLQVGSIIPMRNQKGGLVKGKIVDIHEDTVEMDFNHPMTGNDLYFKGKIVSVRNATEKEIREGRVEHNCTGCGKH